MAIALSPGDPCSFSRPEVCAVTRLHLKLTTDFESSTLKGSVDIYVKRIQGLGDVDNSLVLDARGLTITGIHDKESCEKLNYTLGEPVEPFGSKLEIQLPNRIDTSLAVTIDYETSPDAKALQWMTPKQTAGKRHPYLFSQCQAIHARSLVPCQDTPAVKFTYTAEITAPASLEVLMGALKEETVHVSEDGSQRTHHFEQRVPIPSYLIAIVVGDLESKELSHRCRVWSERELIDSAAYEFAETEQMLQTAEAILTPYEWERYDLLVLPPSFPYGGMENPCLTFVTPTLLAGDRSLADVIVHEISHSWTGNLVTNKNPEHFWLNEGHTMFLQRKITGRMHGEPAQHFSALDGWKDLLEEIKVRGADSPLTHLVPDLKGVDPDDAFSVVPYEKGCTLLFHLEEQLGGPEVFEPFLKAYIQHYKHKSLTSEEWKAFLYTYFQPQGKQGVLNDIDWDAWFHSPGMPPVKPNYDTSLADVCTALCTRWSEASDDNLDQFTNSDIAEMSSNQVREFLSQLLQEPPLSRAKLLKLKVAYRLSEKRNSEIKFRWLRLGLKGHFPEAIEPAINFVTEQGRMKFIRPLYRDMYAWEESRELAVENFLQHRDEMNSIARNQVAKDLNLRD